MPIQDQTVAIIGLGYVGLPLAVAFAEAGTSVVGVEIDPTRPSMIMSGRSYIGDIPDHRVKAVVDAGTLTATVNPEVLDRVNTVIICVPTPLTEHRVPDLRAVESASRVVAAHLQVGQLIVLESTTYPETTEGLLQPILEEGGLRAGVDFSLAFSPERIDPGATGSSGYTLRNTPKLVGGLTPECTERAANLYQAVVDRVVTVDSPRVAELAKLFENIFRNVNIALVNELMMLCDRMDLNVWDVLDAASTKPYGFMRFNPGPGVGGHCIPVDPFYLTWKAREYGMHTRFIELAGEINESMPRYIAGRVIEALNASEKSLKGSHILALGVAYKANISDLRESPATQVIEELIRGGAVVAYHDPHVPEVEIVGAFMTSEPLTIEKVAAADCVVVLTDHAAVDYDLIAEHARLVVDTRNRIPQKSVARA
jgi:UDP-N-acetyl-D-glucosamine dehydrogenase